VRRCRGTICGMWDGAIDARHLYAALRLRVYMYERDGSDSKTVGSGTGFVVRSTPLSGKRKGFLVTNRHVLDPDFAKFTGRKVEKVEAAGFVQPTLQGMISGSAGPVAFTIQSPQPVFAAGGDDADVAVLDLETAAIAGGCPELTELSNLHLASAQDFKSRLHVGAQVLIPGYPGIDLVTAERPILVGGTVASDPREVAEIGPEKFQDNVLCHSFSWGGMSGSPVFAFLPKDALSWGDVQRGNARELCLVGVNRGHLNIGGTAEGALTYFVKSSVLTPLLRDMGAAGLLGNRDDNRPED
jgi:hypothetical protein